MRWTTTLLGLLIAPLLYGQQPCGPKALQRLAADHASQPCTHLGCQGLKGTGQTLHAAVPTPGWYMDTPGMRSAIVSLEFEDEFPTEAIPAVNMAADIWAQSLETVVPITINVVVVGNNATHHIYCCNYALLGLIIGVGGPTSPYVRSC